MTHCLINHHITGHLVIVLVSTEWHMCLTTDNSASCEIHAVIRLIHAKGIRAEEIHCEVYADATSEGTVRQLCRMLQDVHDEERNGRQSAVSDDLVQSVEQKLCERRRFTISELSREFPQTLRIVLYENIKSFVQDGFRKCKKRRKLF
jgi:hypothetical protein